MGRKDAEKQGLAARNAICFLLLPGSAGAHTHSHTHTHTNLLLVSQEYHTVMMLSHIHLHIHRDAHICVYPEDVL